MDETPRPAFTSHPSRSGPESPYDERSISSGGSSHGLPPLHGITAFTGRRHSVTSSAGPGPSHAQRMATFAPPSLNIGSHNQAFVPPSASPSAASTVFQDGLMPDAMMPASGGVSPTHLSSAIISQKRAYRQRRKDPSCDACRERKVKVRLNNSRLELMLTGGSVMPPTLRVALNVLAGVLSASSRKRQIGACPRSSKFDSY